MAVSTESDTMATSEGGGPENDIDATLLDLSQSTWKFILEEQQSAPPGSPKAAMAADALAAGGHKVPTVVAAAAKLTDSEPAIKPVDSKGDSSKVAATTEKAELNKPKSAEENAPKLSPLSPIPKGQLPMAPMRPKSKSAEPPRQTRPAISSDNTTSYIEISDTTLDEDIIINISDEGRFFFIILLFYFYQK